MLPFALVTPNEAAGIVQFKDGNTNLGSPRTVMGGIAIGPLAFLDGGPHSITAVFTPADPAAFGPSTSNAVMFTF